MISFWNAPPESPSADLRPFVELACALGGEGFPPLCWKPLAIGLPPVISTCCASVHRAPNCSWPALAIATRN